MIFLVPVVVAASRGWPAGCRCRRGTPRATPPAPHPHGARGGRGRGHRRRRGRARHRADQRRGREQGDLPGRSCRSGMGSVTAYSDDDGPVDWPRSVRPPSGSCPDATVTEVRGVLEGNGMDTPSYWLEIRAPTAPDRLLESYGSAWGSSTLVSGERRRTCRSGCRPTTGLRPAKMLAAGGVVAFTDQGVDRRRGAAGAAPQRARQHRGDGDEGRRAGPAGAGRPRHQRARRRSSRTAAAAKVGAPVGVAGLLVDRHRSRRTSSRPPTRRWGRRRRTPRSTSSAATRPTTRP